MENARHWQAVSLLSLDLALPFHPFMGLPSEGFPTQAAAREVVTTHRAAGTPELSFRVDAAFETALDRHGADTGWVLTWLDVGHVRHWGDLWPVHQWRDALQEVLRTPELIPRREWVDVMNDIFDDGDTVGQVAAVREQPRTDWDVEQCAYEGYTPYEGRGDIFRSIVTQVRFYRFMQGLVRMHGMLGPDEKAELDSLVVEVATDMGHTLEVESLDALLAGGEPS